jgi:hypothetical protein
MSLDKTRAVCAMAGLLLESLAATCLIAQTRVDLRTQSKSVDFSGAASTKPSQAGTVLPSTCAVGQTFLNTAAQPGQNWYVCTATNTWSVQGANGLANYAMPFTSATTVTVPGSAHQLGTSKLFVEVYDTETPAVLVEPNEVQIDPTTYDVAVSFASPQSGTLVLSAAGGGGGSGSPVTSVFGRIGAVAAQTGDYSFAQVAGSVASNQLPAAGGDLAGTLTSATVAGLQNRTVSTAVPTAGQALVWSAIDNQWEPQNVSLTSGGGMASQLGDFLVTSSSGNTLIIGANCSSATPCNVRVGSTVYSLTEGATVTLSGGTGQAYIYIDFSGNLTVGHNLTLTCSAGCVALSGVTSFPVNAIPLFTWSATNGTWSSAGTDERAFLSANALVAGPGIITIQSGAQTQVAVDSAAVPTFLTASTMLTFGSIPAASCAELPFSLLGAAPGNAVEPGWPSSLEQGLIGNMRVSASNVITVRLCNFSGAALTPAPNSYTATIVRSF